MASVRALPFVALVLLAFGCAALPAESDGAVRDADADAGSPAPATLRWLRDDRGGVVLLRGTNVTGDSKSPPDFLPDDYVIAADFARLRDELGMNAIRFLIFWEAVEPEEGLYDDAYLAEVRRRIEEAGAAGLRVIVDMHQDVYGRGFNSDGAPRWSCDEALYDAFEPPAEWYLGYFEPEVQTCFDRLYGDPRIRGAFAAAWQRVAEALADVDAVFGYEVLNEPHWGTSSVRTFEQTTLPAFYEECIDAIRSADPEAYVFIAPSSTVNVGLRTRLDPPDRPRLVYAPHIYPGGLEQGSGWSGTRASLDAWLAGLREDAIAMDLPLVVTELGARASVPGATQYLADVYDALDAAAFGAMQWDAGREGYGLWDAELVAGPVALAIARPHPARVAGLPRAFAWDAEAGIFTLEWDEDGSALGDTVLTAPTLAFPSGFDVSEPDARVEGTTLIVPQRGGPRSITLTRR